jgi:hypothetical protein
VVYLVFVSLAFIVAYGVMDVRELGLYLVLFMLNLPASAVVLPLSERLSTTAGWSSGSAAQVLLVQGMCMAVNAVLLAAVVRASKARFGKRKQAGRA